MSTRKQGVKVPELDHDAMMLQRFEHRVPPHGRVERRIVANLIAHLNEAGWDVREVDDGEERTKVNGAKAAMELIFNLDDCYLYFVNEKKKTSWVRLILGNGNNGLDIISDWLCVKGFDEAISAFDPEDFA